MIRVLRGSGWVKSLPIRSEEEAWDLTEEKLKGGMEVVQTKVLDYQVVCRFPVRLQERWKSGRWNPPSRELADWVAIQWRVGIDS